LEQEFNFDVMECNKRLFGTFGQLAIFPKELETPFNYVDDERMAQHFAVREKRSFTFLPPNEFPWFNVSVHFGLPENWRERGDIAVITPFEIAANTTLEISTIIEEFYITPSFVINSIAVVSRANAGENFLEIFLSNHSTNTRLYVNRNPILLDLNTECEPA